MDPKLVAKTAETLFSTGQRPTVRRVRQSLGYGSFEDIAPALKAWWQRDKPLAEINPVFNQQLEELLTTHAAECERLKSEGTAREKLAYERLEGLRRHLYLETDAARERSRVIEEEVLSSRKTIRELQDQNLTLMRQMRDVHRQEQERQFRASGQGS